MKRITIQQLLRPRNFNLRLGALMELGWVIIILAFWEFKGQYQAHCTTVPLLYNRPVHFWPCFQGVFQEGLGRLHCPTVAPRPLVASSLAWHWGAIWTFGLVIYSTHVNVSKTRFDALMALRLGMTWLLLRDLQWENRLGIKSTRYPL